MNLIKVSFKRWLYVICFIYFTKQTDVIIGQKVKRGELRLCQIYLLFTQSISYVTIHPPICHPFVDSFLLSFSLEEKKQPKQNQRGHQQTNK